MKGTNKKIKTQATDLKQIFAKCISDKVYVVRIYKELLKLNNKTNDPIFLMANGMNRHFTKKVIQIAKEPVKKNVQHH